MLWPSKNWHVCIPIPICENYSGPLHGNQKQKYLVDPKIVIKIYNISTLHMIMYVLKYRILNSFAQNPAISTFFRKVHSDEREFAG